MSKLFNKYYKLYMEQAYSEDSFISLLALKNTTSDFVKATPLTTGGVEYLIHIPKRLKPKEVTISTETSNALAMLDSLENFEWDTRVVTVTKAHTLGIKATEIGDNLFVGGNAGLFKTHLKNSVSAITALRMSNVIDTLLKDSPNTHAASTTDIWGQIAKDIEMVAREGDNFLYNTAKSKILVWVNPLFALNIAKEKGITFRNEVPVFNTGMTAKESINGAPMFRNTYLSTKQVGGKAVAYIVFSMNSIYFDYLVPKVIEQRLGLVNFTGYYFFDLLLQVFANRIRIGTFTGPVNTASIK